MLEHTTPSQSQKNTRCRNGANGEAVGVAAMPVMPEGLRFLPSADTGLLPPGAGHSVDGGRVEVHTEVDQVAQRELTILSICSFEVRARDGSASSRSRSHQPM